MFGKVILDHAPLPPAGTLWEVPPKFSAHFAPTPPPSQEGVPRKDNRYRSGTWDERGLDVGAGMNVKSLSFRSIYAGRW